MLIKLFSWKRNQKNIFFFIFYRIKVAEKNENRIDFVFSKKIFIICFYFLVKDRLKVQFEENGNNKKKISIKVCLTGQRRCYAGKKYMKIFTKSINFLFSNKIFKIIFHFKNPRLLDDDDNYDEFAQCTKSTVWSSYKLSFAFKST